MTDPNHTAIAVVFGLALLTLIGWLSGAISRQVADRMNQWLQRFGQRIGALSSIGAVLLFLLALVWLVLFGVTVVATFGGLLALQADPGSGGLGLGAVLIGLLGAPFLIWNTVIKQTTLNFQKEGHITDRISKAVEQLGAEKTIKVRGKDANDNDITIEESKPNIEVRIGGLFSLERIAQDSTRYDRGRDHVRVMEILCAYVRENAPASGAKQSIRERYEELTENTEHTPGLTSQELADLHGPDFEEAALDDDVLRRWAEALPQPREDIAIALRIIGRRGADQLLAEARWGNGDPHVTWVFDDPCPMLPDQLRSVSLTQAELTRYRTRVYSWQTRISGYRGYVPDLRNTNLQRADLSGATLSGAILIEARMQGANLKGSRLEGADLTEVWIQGADLTRANIGGAYLGGARAEIACLAAVRAEGAHFEGARMTNSNLVQAQLDGADLSKTWMKRAILSDARLRAANLEGVQMHGADLSRAWMDGANLTAAQLDAANLSYTWIVGAHLAGASLRSAKLGGWTIERSYIGSANLSGATTLRQHSINTAWGNSETILPEFIVRPDHWLDEPQQGSIGVNADYHEWITKGAPHGQPRTIR
jgi:uncharacterized protein YjbI with pentapeptide repeats